MQIKLKYNSEYKGLVELLSDNEEASKIYIDICSKNDEVEELLVKLIKSLKCDSCNKLEIFKNMLE